MDLKELFGWRFPPSECDFSDLWDNGIFIFDTNFLLNLYRISSKSADESLKILERLQDRTWLPYQVAHEFFENWEKVIDSEIKSFENASSIIDKWCSELKKSLDPLKRELTQSGRFISTEINFLFEDQDDFIVAFEKAAEKVAKAAKNKLNELEKKSAIKSKEEILERIIALFGNNIGTPFIEEELIRIRETAESRYENKIPPGFEDKSKGSNKYGDYIIWYEILNFAKNNSKPVIFITAERKEDWWLKREGRIVAPLPALRREFQSWANQNFWMYHSDIFLKRAGKYLDIEVDQETIDEITEAEDRSTFLNGSSSKDQSRNNQFQFSNFDALTYLEEQAKIYEPGTQMSQFLQAHQRHLDLINPPLLRLAQDLKAYEQATQVPRFFQEQQRHLDQVQQSVIDLIGVQRFFQEQQRHLDQVQQSVIDLIGGQNYLRDKPNIVEKQQRFDEDDSEGEDGSTE